MKYTWLATFYIRGFPKVDHSGRSARIVLECDERERILL